MPTSLPSCNTLTALTTLTCSGLYEAGGVDARIYIGRRSDIATVTSSAAGITALTLTGSTKLIKLIGKPYVNSSNSEDGDLTSNSRLKTHTVTWVGNQVTQAETDALEALGNSRNLFVIVELESGKFQVYGLDKNPATGLFTDARRGLMAKVTISKSAEINTPNSAQVVFSASDMYSHPVAFGEASTNAANITALEALC